MAENTENETFNDFYRNYLNENAGSNTNAELDNPAAAPTAAPTAAPSAATVKSALAANINDTATGASPVPSAPSNAPQTPTNALANTTPKVSALAEIARGNQSFTATAPADADKSVSTDLSAPTANTVASTPSAAATPVSSTLASSAGTNGVISAPSASTLQDLANDDAQTKTVPPTADIRNEIKDDKLTTPASTAGSTESASKPQENEIGIKPAKAPKPAKELGIKEDKPTPPVFYTVAVILITILLAFATVAVSAKFGLLNGLVSTNVGSDYVTNQANRAYQKDDVNPNWEKIFADVNPSVVSIEIIVGQSQELGSGFIYDSNGTIITNNHVVADAAADKTGKATISVTLADGRIFEAEIIGRDELTDLAAIKLKNAPEGLTAMEFDNSDDVTVGDRVMAVGNPLGLANTATTGIVSALDRPVSAGDSATSGSVVVSNSIQIDAAINPGNSGGPLFDASAKVIGVNSSIAQTSSSSGSIGLGFAIPSNTAKLIIDAIIKDGSVKHAALGVSAQSAQVSFDGSDHRATKIVEVGKDSPAEKAGITKGDYIVGMNGKPVISNLSLIGFINALPLNTEIKLSIIRDGKQQEITVKLDKERDWALSGLSSSSDQKATPSAPDSDSFDPFEELER